MLTDINKGYESVLNYQTIDRFMVNVLWWHLGAFLLLAFLNSVIKIANILPSPLSWRVISSTEAVVTVAVAFIASLVPFFLINKIPNHYLWRILVTTALTIYSYLFVFVSGGAIEMHFHFFIIAALLVVYTDWRLGWLLLILTALHHVILNFLAPGWVYFYGRNDIAVVAHAVPVLVVVIFTTVLCRINHRSIRKLTDTQTGLEKQTMELEKLKDGLESKVAERTEELNEKLSELGRVNKFMVDREVRMVALKKEISVLQAQSQNVKD